MKLKQLRAAGLMVIVFIFCFSLSACGAFMVADDKKALPPEADTKEEEPEKESDKELEEEESEKEEPEKEETEKEETDQKEPQEKPENEEEQLELILSRMTLEEKVGQLFFVRCPDQSAAELAQEYQPGGYLLFARDFQDKKKADVEKDIDSYQSSVKIPMLIGVDEEGGTVVRVSKFKAFRKTPFLSPQKLYDEGGLELIKEDVKEKAELLRSVGIMVNFAPVCDVSTDAEDFMNARSFGKAAEPTAEYVETVVEQMEKSRLGSVLKHFPGYGNNEDTHTGIANDSRTYDTFVESDFLPFSAGIQAGADAVLVSHNVIACMDDKYPASLSDNVHRILREELGFEGVIITDDLSMDAVKLYTGADEAAVLAVLAGNDMLCCTDFQVQIPAVVGAVREGRISESSIDSAVLRVLRWKRSLGLL